MTTTDIFLMLEPLREEMHNRSAKPAKRLLAACAAMRYEATFKTQLTEAQQEIAVMMGFPAVPGTRVFMNEQNQKAAARVRAGLRALEKETRL